MNRRTFLAAAPVVGLAVLPALASVETDTPVMRLYREWSAIFHNQGVGMSDDDFNALCDQGHEISVMIENTPCQTMQDMAAKIIASSGDGAFDIDMAVVMECRTFVERAA